MSNIFNKFLLSNVLKCLNNNYIYIYNINIKKYFIPSNANFCIYLIQFSP